MNTLIRRRVTVVAYLALAGASVVAVACSGDDSTAPITEPGRDSGGSDAPVTPVTDSGTPDSPTGPTLAPPGCFAGTPASSLDFMNACTTASYVVFDNCARSGICDGGALPALVPPPKPDAGTPDAGSDAAPDAASDAGEVDATTDAAPADADTDSG